MIIDKLNRWERVAGMHPAFKMVFDFIGRTDFSHMPAGRIALDGERVFINLDEPEGTTREEQAPKCIAAISTYMCRSTPWRR